MNEKGVSPVWLKNSEESIYKWGKTFTQNSCWSKSSSSITPFCQNLSEECYYFRSASLQWSVEKPKWLVIWYSKKAFKKYQKSKGRFYTNLINFLKVNSPLEKLNEWDYHTASLNLCSYNQTEWTKNRLKPYNDHQMLFLQLGKST